MTGIIIGKCCLSLSNQLNVIMNSLQKAILNNLYLLGCFQFISGNFSEIHQAVPDFSVESGMLRFCEIPK